MTAVDLPSDSQKTTDSIVSVRRLRKHFPIKEGVFQRVTGHVKAVDGVDFDIRRGEIVGMVGESGCGKTTLGRCISGLTEPTDGGVYFDLPRDDERRLDALLGLRPEARSASDAAALVALDERYRVDRLSGDRWRHYRRNCQVVFQDAFSSLNPRHLVKDIVGRPLRIHKEASGAELTERTVELLEQVGMGRQHLYRYPHQFSGGQRQRISVARALALEPDFLVLDEPTSSLDVSVQAQILNLLHHLQAERLLTYLFISHDLNVVQHMSDRIIVMYLGTVVEEGPSAEVFASPRHPYTDALLAANPSMEDMEHLEDMEDMEDIGDVEDVEGLPPAAASVDAEEEERVTLAGSVPDPARPPQGCRFHTRCPVATPDCGWEVDDVVRLLEESDVLSGLDRVQRHSPFAAELSFEREDQAAALLRELAAAAPESMQDAVDTLRQDGATVTVRFLDVNPVELATVAPAHRSSCLLTTGQDTRRTRSDRS